MGYLDDPNAPCYRYTLLLCNCFKAMGKSAFVVLGDGVPEGRTAYVLTKDLLKKETTLWNASTGKSYTTELLHCPLTSVGLVFDDTNIWANVQPYDEPHLIDWHFDDARNWRPFFGGRGGFEEPDEMENVQAAELRYRTTSDEYRANIERGSGLAKTTSQALVAQQRRQWSGQNDVSSASNDS